MPFGEARTLGFNNQPLARLLVANSIITSKGIFLYSGTPAAGNLIASLGVTTAGTDRFGNAYLTGVTGYSAAFAVRLAVQISGGTGVAQAIRFYTAASAAGPWNAQGSIGADTSGNLYLVPGSATGGIAIPIGTLPASGVVNNALLLGDASGFLRMIAGLAGDTNAYFLQYFRVSATATPQTISSTSATTITGCTAPVGIARYAFKAKVAFHGASASGTANFSVTGPAVTSQWITAMFAGTGAVGVGFQNTALGPVNSFTQTTTEMIADIEGEGTFTAQGTIALACAISSGGANVIIDRADFWLYPLS